MAMHGIQLPYPSDCLECATRTDRIRRDNFLTLPIAWSVQQEQTKFAVTISYPSDCLECATRTDRIRRDSSLSLPIAWSVQQGQTELAVTISLPFRLLGVCNKNRQNSP